MKLFVFVLTFQMLLAFLPECAAGYEARSYPRLRGINTQIVEQNNAKIKKLKSSLSYMKSENFMDTLKLFLWYNNDQINKKNNLK